MRQLLCILLLLASNAQASEPLTLSAQDQVQVSLTPGDEAGALVVDAIAKAKRHILVQAHSLTHKDIAQALIATQKRGIDVGTPNAAVITGSFNFTHAAQLRNAENLLVLRGNLLLADAYAANWRRHRIHSLPFKP